MFCAKCGEKLTEDTKFCGKCGAAVQAGDASQSPGQGAEVKSSKSKLVGWLLVAVGVALPFVAQPAEFLAVPLLWVGFAMVLGGSSVIVRAGKGLIAMLVVFGSIFFLKEQIPATQTTSSNVRVDQEIALAQLLTDYEANEISADNKYKGKIIRASGVIQDVSKNVLDQPFVVIGVGVQPTIPALQCTLARSAVDYAASLTAGQPVIIQGKVTGLMMNVQAENCTFVKPEELSKATKDEATTGQSDESHQVMPTDEKEGAGDEEQTAEAVSDNREQQCTTTYRSATAEDYSPEAVAEYKSECPGYDLPAAWQEAAGSAATEQPDLLPASFDCAKAGTAVEKMICSDPKIANLDGQVAQAYAAAIAASTDPNAVKSQQREWVKLRDACKEPACVTSAYESRIGELQE